MKKKLLACICILFLVLPGLSYPCEVQASTVKYVKVNTAYVMNDKYGFTSLTSNGKSQNFYRGVKSLKLTLKREGKYVIKTINQKGQKKTTTLYVDGTKPKIKCVMSTNKINVTVTDDRKLSSVSLNYQQKKSKFTITEPGTYKIIAKDKAGNKAVHTVTLNKQETPQTKAPVTEAPVTYSSPDTITIDKTPITHTPTVTATVTETPATYSPTATATVTETPILCTTPTVTETPTTKPTPETETATPVTPTPTATATPNTQEPAETPSSTIEPTAIPNATVPPIGGRIVHSGAYEKTTWTIDVTGLLEIKGTGDMYPADVGPVSNTYPEWYNYKSKIKSARIEVTGATHLNYLFYKCSGLTSVDLSNLDTSNVTNMTRMFSDCSNLTNIDLSYFDTSNVTNMMGMFSGCSSLTIFDLNNFDTSNVTSMSEMFANCSNLVYLDVSKLNTSKVTDMSWMFGGCSALENLDVRNFNTSNVKSMRGMFALCNTSTFLGIKDFNISNETDTTNMFL